MTFEQLLVVIEGRKILRHQGRVFFMIYDAEEATRFKDLGAYVTEAGGEGQWGWGASCWEVSFANLLDPMIELIDGEEKDVRAEFLLNHFRERDGFEVAVLAR